MNFVLVDPAVTMRSGVSGIRPPVEDHPHRSTTVGIRYYRSSMERL